MIYGVEGSEVACRGCVSSKSVQVEGVLDYRH